MILPSKKSRKLLIRNHFWRFQMALVINTNLGSINGLHTLEKTSTALSVPMTRLTSGSKVNGAMDDAAGLAIADGMQSQINGMSVAMRNANDAISLVQTADGALGQINDTLQRMRELALQSANSATVSSSDRDKLQTEFSVLNDEVTRIIENTEFNGKKLLNGDLEIGLVVQVGATAELDSRMTVAISNMKSIVSPVAESTLAPDLNVNNSLVTSLIDQSIADVTNDTLLIAANDAAKLANVAIAATEQAIQSPMDLELAKIASIANTEAARAIARVSENVLQATTNNNAANLTSDEFVNIVANASEESIAIENAITADNDRLQNSTETNIEGASSLSKNAQTLASIAQKQILLAGKSVYTSSMNTLKTNIFAAYNPLNQITDIDLETTNAGQATKKAMIFAAVGISKAVAGASFVDNFTTSQQENEMAKDAFISHHYLVNEALDVVSKLGEDNSLSAVSRIDVAIDLINKERAVLGSIQNPFTATISNLANGIRNQSSARSQIMDADFAQETANLSRAQILQQAGTAMLAQANKSGQSVLTLLR